MRNIPKIPLQEQKLIAKILVPNVKEFMLYDKGILSRIKVDNVKLTGTLVETTPRVLVVNTPLQDDILEHYTIVIDLSQSIAPPKHYQFTAFDFICNPDASLRWLYPNTLKVPSFLAFYSAATLKSKLFAKAIRMAFAFKLKAYVKNGSFMVHHKKPLFIQTITNQQKAEQYSIFTGTVGENRKALFELNTKGKASYFVKYPLNNNSLTLINSEKERLLALNNTTLKQLVTPKVIDSELCHNVLIQTAINGDAGLRHTDFTPTHSEALVELFHESESKEKLENLTAFQQAVSRLEEIKTLAPISLSEEIRLQLNALLSTIDRQEVISTSTAHVDFTPWNMYVNDKVLKVYDWELAQAQYPFLFDLYHYIFQSNILIGKASYDDIMKKIDSALQPPAIATIIKEENINTQLHFKMYLLINISYYLTIYMKQDTLHKQAYWLLGMWQLTLKTMLNATQQKSSDRQYFIKDLVLFLNQQGLKYGVLKSTYKDLYALDESSDIDLLIDAKDIPAINDFIDSICLSDKVLVWQRSNLTTIEIFFEDHSFLSLDLVSSFKQKHTVYLEAEEVLKSVYQYNNSYFKLSPQDDFDYIINFYLLNNSEIPNKYVDYFLNLPLKEQEVLVTFMKSKYCLEYAFLQELFASQKTVKQTLIAHTHKMGANRGGSQLKHRMTYLKDTLRELSSNRAFVITFSGVDGAGKTTVINEIVDYVSHTLRKQVVQLRHRPSILPILSAIKYGKEGAESRSVARLPRQGKNQSVILSMVRFSYYYLDYMLGQFYINMKYTRRGKIVIYDRYYFDFINDPRRTNLALPTWFTKALYRLLLKPKLNFYLYANADVILKRKKELSAEDIESLNHKYLSTFTQFDKQYKKSHYCAIENLVLEETLDTIKGKITQVM